MSNVKILVCIVALCTFTGCVTPGRLYQRAELKELHLCLYGPSGETAILSAWITYDFTGGQVRAAVERGEKEVTVDPSRIPPDPTPELVGMNMASNARSGVYRGSKQIGTVNGLVNHKGGVFVILNLEEPIEYPDLDDLPKTPWCPWLSCGKLDGNKFKEDEAIGPCTYYIEPSLERAVPCFPSLAVRD